MSVKRGDSKAAYEMFSPSRTQIKVATRGRNFGDAHPRCGKGGAKERKQRKDNRPTKKEIS